MQIYSQLAPLALGGAHGSAVAMGFFDGIHIGHRAVINGAVEWARAHGAAPAVFTFRLPVENKMKGKRLLSSADKHALIASLGVEYYLTPDFEEIKGLTPEQFVLGIIRDCNDEVLAKNPNRTVLLPRFSCHTLRHTFTTRMCEAGVNIKVIQDALGHSDISTTLNIYADVTKELRKSEFENLDRQFAQWKDPEE